MIIIRLSVVGTRLLTHLVCEPTSAGGIRKAGAMVLYRSDSPWPPADPYRELEMQVKIALQMVGTADVNLVDHISNRCAHPSRRPSTPIRSRSRPGSFPRGFA